MQHWKVLLIITFSPFFVLLHKKKCQKYIWSKKKNTSLLESFIRWPLSSSLASASYGGHFKFEGNKTFSKKFYSIYFSSFSPREMWSVFQSSASSWGRRLRCSASEMRGVENITVCCACCCCCCRLERGWWRSQSWAAWQIGRTLYSRRLRRCLLG